MCDGDPEFTVHVYSDFKFARLSSSAQKHARASAYAADSFSCISPLAVSGKNTDDFDVIPTGESPLVPARLQPKDLLHWLLTGPDDDNPSLEVAMNRYSRLCSTCAEYI